MHRHASRHVDDAERRARLGIRHALAAGHHAGGVEDAARAVVLLHGTEPASVHVSAWARTDVLDRAEVDAAFFDRRTLVRQLCLRGTLFGLPRDLLAPVVGSVGRRVAERTRRDLENGAARAGSGNGAAWVAAARAAVLETVSAAGQDGLNAAEIRERTPAASGSYRQGEGTRWASTVSLAPRVIGLLGVEGLLMRCGNDGDWRANRWRWTSAARWLGAPVAAVDASDGYRELVRRWLTAYGPGTVTDAAWWLGATKQAVRTAFAELGAVAVSLDGVAEPGWLLPDDVAPVAAPEPWVALLPLLDPTIMGWRERGFLQGPHGPQLYDSVGNAGTTAWVGGRVVGVWVQDAAGAVEVRLLEPVPAGPRRALTYAAARMTAWLDGQRVFSVYPSPAMQG